MNIPKPYQLTALLLGSFTLVYGQTSAVTSTSTANYQMIVAPESLVAAWGRGLATVTTAANVSTSGNAVVLPDTLGGTRVSITDSAKTSANASLYLASPGQVNYVIPASTALGKATLTVSPGGGTGTVLVSNVAPGIFTADLSGGGVAAAQVLRVSGGGQATYESPVQTGGSSFVARMIDLGASSSDKVYIILYGTGIRRHSLNPVIAMVGDVAVPVLFAGAQPQYPGLDQVNIGPLPASLAGKGTVDVKVTVDGVPSNTAKLAFR